MKLPFQMLSKLNSVLRNGYVFCLNMYTCPLYLKQHTSVYYAVYFPNEKMFTSTPEKPFFINVLFLMQGVQYDSLLRQLVSFVICH